MVTLEDIQHSISLNIRRDVMRHAIACRKCEKCQTGVNDSYNEGENDLYRRRPKYSIVVMLSASHDGQK